MIQFKNITIARGVKVLIQAATLQLHPGHKVGLTGANGVGKSSLFAMLRGDFQADKGDLNISTKLDYRPCRARNPSISNASIAICA